MIRIHSFLGSVANLAVALLLVPALPVCASEHSQPPAAPPKTSIPAFCFAPGTPPDVVERTLDRAARSFERNSLSPQNATKYRTVNRWTFTATDGGGLSQGDPTTLTWSVVPDGTAIPAEFGFPAAGSNLRAFLNGIYGNEATWLALFQQVFDRWAALTGISYVYEPNDDGAALSGLGGVDGSRGDIRIGGKLIDGGGAILAYNYFPNDGDMVIDTGDSFYNNTSGNSLGFRNTVSHEHGHGLGVDHVCPINQTKLMEPFLSFGFDGPQHDDILAANRSYGDRFEHDDTPGQAAPLGSIGSTMESNLSVDSNTDADVYSFVVDAIGAVDVTITPTGMTYLEGPQNGPPTYSCTAGTSYDTLNIQDLELRVLDVNGTTELAAADVNGVGQPEDLNDVMLLSGAGTYFVEVTGDSSDAAQLYELSMTVSPSDQIFAEGFESGDTTAWSSTVP